MDRPCARAVKVDCPYPLSQITARNSVVWALTEQRALLYREGVSSFCPEGEQWKCDIVRYGPQQSHSSLTRHLGEPFLAKPIPIDFMVIVSLETLVLGIFSAPLPVDCWTEEHITICFRVWDKAQLVEYLPSMHEALSSILSTA